MLQTNRGRFFVNNVRKRLRTTNTEASNTGRQSNKIRHWKGFRRKKLAWGENTKEERLVLADLAQMNIDTEDKKIPPRELFRRAIETACVRSCVS